MKTIHVFLASSDELLPDRDSFGDLIRRLDNIYEKRGIRIELFRWEDHLAAYNTRRKQDEYNDKIRESQIFVALFHKKAGTFTIEEFNVALSEYEKKSFPVVYVYCKDLVANEKESEDLINFKERLFKEMGHYWCRYGNSDTLKLHFVLQLQLIEGDIQDDFVIQKGNVFFAGLPIADFNNLTFAQSNKAYYEMSQRLLSLKKEESSLRELLQTHCNDAGIARMYHDKLLEVNDTEKAIDDYRHSLLEAAREITAIIQNDLSSEMMEAISAFNSGDITKANVLLDLINSQAEVRFESFKFQRETIYKDIDALKLQARMVLANLDLLANQRISKAQTLYDKALMWALETHYPKERLFTLYLDYFHFLAFFKLPNQVDIARKAHSLSLEVYGAQSLQTARCLTNWGNAVLDNDSESALKCYNQALTIYEQFKSSYVYIETTVINDNIGHIFAKQKDYEKAIEIFKKSLDVQLDFAGGEFSETAAISYLDLGDSYYMIERFKDSEEAYLNSISILERSLLSPETLAIAYNNYSRVLISTERYSEAKDYLIKAISLFSKHFGTESLSYSTSIYLLANVYAHLREYDRALLEYKQVLDFISFFPNQGFEKAYRDIASIEEELGNFDDSITHYLESLKECKISRDSIEILENIGDLYYRKGKESPDYHKALEYYTQAFSLCKGVYAANDHHCVNIALKQVLIFSQYGEPMLDVLLKLFRVMDEDNKEYIDSKKGVAGQIGLIYYEKGCEKQALQFFLRSIPDRPQRDSGVLLIISKIYFNKKKYKASLDAINNALSLVEKTNPLYEEIVSFRKIVEEKNAQYGFWKALFKK